MKEIKMHYPGENTIRVLTPVDIDHFYYEVACLDFETGNLLEFTPAVGFEEACHKAEEYRHKYSK